MDLDLQIVKCMTKFGHTMRFSHRILTHRTRLYHTLFPHDNPVRQDQRIQNWSFCRISMPHHNHIEVEIGKILLRKIIYPHYLHAYYGTSKWSTVSCTEIRRTTCNYSARYIVCVTRDFQAHSDVVKGYSTLDTLNKHGTI